MAKNKVFDFDINAPFSVVVTDPASPSSGDAVRFGSLTGVALTDEGDGQDVSTETTVEFGLAIWDLPVKGEAGAISVGDALFYDDGISAVNNDATNGYFFGFALEAVGNGETTTINVLHTPSPGAGTLGDGTITTAKLAALAVDATKLAADAVTTAKILDANVTEAKLAAASLTGLVAKVVADANVIGGIPVLHRIDVADGTGNTDVVLTHKTRVIDAWGVNTGIGAHATDDTWQVKNGANAISDAVAKTATVNAIKRISTIDPATADIAAGGTLRIAAVKDTNSAVTVYVLGIRVA